MDVWTIFTIIIVGCLMLDLGVFGRRDMTFREALAQSAVWIAVALAFNVGVWHYKGIDAAEKFFAGYLLEKSLGVDNLFVFVVIFKQFAIPSHLQKRVLMWGFLGALVMRGIFIYLGIAIVEKFHFVMYFFGLFLVFTAYKLLSSRGEEHDAPSPSGLTWLKKIIPHTDQLDGERFFVRKNNRWFATPMFQALIAIELSDVLFAFDSVPAILAITNDSFIVYTSNVFALLGLRSLYFALAGMVKAFHYLDIGIALAVGFIGLKILLADWVHIPEGPALMVVVGFLIIGMLGSLVWRKK